MKNTEERIEKALYYMQNDTLKAIEIFDEILQDEPENVNAINGKGSSYMKLNRMEDAEKYFDLSLSIEKTSSALISKGIINKNKKEYEHALHYYDDAIRVNAHLKTIITHLKNEICELIELEKCSSELIKKGMEHKNANRLNDALKCYRKAIEADESCKSSVEELIDEIEILLRQDKTIENGKLDSNEA